MNIISQYENAGTYTFKLLINEVYVKMKNINLVNQPESTFWLIYFFGVFYKIGISNQSTERK